MQDASFKYEKPWTLNPFSCSVAPQWGWAFNTFLEGTDMKKLFLFLSMSFFVFSSLALAKEEKKTKVFKIGVSQIVSHPALVA